MKNKLLKKLNNNDGASLMLALLFFVVCAVIGSIILTAAMTASGRMTGIKKNSEEYYALKSAVQVFQSDWSYGETTMFENNSGTKEVRPVSPSNVTKDYQYITGMMASRNKMALEVYKSGEPQTMTYTIKAPNMPDVKAAAKMDSKYNTEIVFNLSETKDTVEGTGTVTLIFSGGVTTTITDNVEYTQVTWSSPEVYLGGTLR